MAGEVTEEKPKTGLGDLQAALEQRRAAEAAETAAPATPGPAAEEPPAAPAKKAAAKKAPAKKATSKRPAKKAAPKPAPEPEPEEEPETETEAGDETGEAGEGSVDALAGLRRDEQPQKVQLGQRVSAETARRFRRFTAVEQINQGDFLDLAIREALERYAPGY